MPRKRAQPASVACSFCFKPSTEVKTLVAGPGVYICNECVELSAFLVSTRAQTARTTKLLAPWELDITLDEVLTHLPRVAAATAQVERNLTEWVRKGRALGATWARLGEALGMTRQSAWERFSGEE